MLLVLPATRPVALEPLLRRRPFLLLPVADKPLLSYHLDLASSIAATRVIVVTDDRPEEVRAFAGKGQAWGLSVEVVAMETGLGVPEQLRRLGLSGDDVRVLSADALVPPVAGDRERRAAPDRDWVDDDGPVLFRWRDGGSPPAGPGAGAVPVRARSRTRLARYAALHRELLEDDGGFVLPGYAVAPGVRICSGCSMSLGAVASPPVLVGERARVSYRANLGPAVVIGAGSFVDEEATLADSVVLPGTYVGRLLAGAGLILDGQLIVNPRTGDAAAIGDTLLLADMSRSLVADRLLRVRDRVAGVVLMALATPLAIVAWLSTRSPRLAVREVYGSHVRLAVDGSADRILVEIHEFQTPRLLLRRLGWLVDLVAGRLSLFGNPPLDAERAAGMEPAIRHRWLEAPTGVFGLAQVEALERGGPLDANAEAAASAIYASSAAGAGKVALLLRCLLAALRPSAWRSRG